MNKRIINMALIAVLATSLVGCSSSKEATSEPASGLYKAGKYTSTAKGFGGDLTVEVEFSSDKIENVTVLSHSETAGIGEKAVAELSKTIVEKQTAEVDGVTGATYSSTAIKEAVADAIKQAKGETTPTAEVVDGVYEGTSNGKGGEIKVAVTIKDGKIYSVKPVSHHETIGFDRAFAIVENDMISTNSTDVDTVTSATMASGGMIRATQEALKEAGFADSFSKASGEVVREVLDTEYTADVIVIGAGGAGINAAIEAKANGASVIVIDKAPVPGGNTKLADGVLNASETDMQAAKGVVDSNDDFYENTITGGDNVAKPELVRKLVENSAEAIQDTRDIMGVVWYNISLGGGHSAPRCHFAEGEGAQLFETMYQHALSQGVDFKFNTTATEILKNEAGEVIGVKATNGGKDVVFNSNKGVVLATGGYGQNAEILKKYDTTYIEGTICTNSILSTGDGIGLAQAAGANLVGMEYVQKHPTCNAATGDLISSANSGRGSGTTIMVNKEGVRFVEELERRDVISNATAIQTGGVSFSFFDQKAADETKFFETFGDEINSLISSGQAVKADTIEEACNFFEIDYNAFMETVEKYNGFAKAGKDDDFNRRGGLREYSTTEGPFYFIKAAPAVHHTMGGVEITENAEVLNTTGEVIPNLFAAGEVTGGIHGSNRLGGNAITDLFVFGKIAGENAAK